MPQSGPVRIGVLAPHHVGSLGAALAAGIENLGHRALLLDRPPEEGWSLDLYVVLCPQRFKRLPPAERRIVYQLEQFVASRYFSPSYIKLLRYSRRVWDYSFWNCQALMEKEIYLQPPGLLPPAHRPDFLPEKEVGNRQFDFLFYGWLKGSPHREKLLRIFRKAFSCRVVTGLFGRELDALIRQARFVLNLHYYENGPLETVRLTQALALGTPVLSESAPDREDSADLAQGICWLEKENLQDERGMITRAHHALRQRNLLARGAREAACARWKIFESSLERVLRREGL